MDLIKNRNYPVSYTEMTCHDLLHLANINSNTEAFKVLFHMHNTWKN